MNDDAASRLRDALELADLAERMVRARWRRERPDLTDDEVEARVLAWLQEDRALPHDADGEGRSTGLRRRP